MGTLVNPDILTNGQTVSFDDTPADNYYSFTMNSAGAILLSGTGAYGSATFKIFDTDFNLVDSSSVNSSWSASLDRSGTYYIQAVDSYGGSFSVTSNQMSGSTISATPITNGQTVSFDDTPADNYYSFTMNSAGNILLSGAGAYGSATFKIFDTDFNLVDSSSVNSSWSASLDQSGTYYIQAVDSYGGSFSVTSNQMSGIPPNIDDEIDYQELLDKEFRANLPNAPTSKDEIKFEVTEDERYVYFFVDYSGTRDLEKGVMSVDYTTIDGTATAGEDYIATSGTLNIYLDETYAVIPVEIIDDNLMESDEEFSLQISNPVNGSFPNDVETLTVSRTIIDNDDPSEHPLYPHLGTGDGTASDPHITGMGEFVYNNSLHLQIEVVNADTDIIIENIYGMDTYFGPSIYDINYNKLQNSTNLDIGTYFINVNSWANVDYGAVGIYSSGLLEPENSFEIDFVEEGMNSFNLNSHIYQFNIKNHSAITINNIDDAYVDGIYDSNFTKIYSGGTTSAELEQGNYYLMMDGTNWYAPSDQEKLFYFSTEDTLL